MIPMVEERRDEVAALCRRFGVRRLEIFGSGSTGAFREGESDLDFLVEFEDPLRGDYAERFFGFMDALQVLFGLKVDLVVDDAIRNPYFRSSVDQSRALLYAA